ncbi:MAG TPA: 6-bladed beta-propeller [Trebonia sp.]|nr:6-bladed beta-propeller [Trebonia sp.]
MNDQSTSGDEAPQGPARRPGPLRLAALRRAIRHRASVRRTVIAACAAVAVVVAASGAAAAVGLTASHPALTAASTASSSSSSVSSAASAAVPAGTLSIDASTPTTTANGVTSVSAGTNITFDYTASTANSTNWVGVYQQGQTPGDVSSSAWAYAPAASGNVSVTTGSLAPGSYEAWLFYDNEYGEMSAGLAFTVSGTGTITVSGAASVVDGLNITFAYTADPANSENWIGIYTNGDTSLGDYQTWAYTPGASGTSSFSTAGLNPGTYQAYLFYDDGYGVLAGPVTFTVTPAPAVPQPVYKGTLESFGGTAVARPSGIATDPSGDVWAVDADQDQVVELAASGREIRHFGTSGSGSGQLSGPEAIAVNGSDVFVADTGNNRIEEFTTSGRFVATIGGPGTGNGQFTQPEGVAVDASGTLYVSDTEGNRVEEFSASGAFQKAVTAGMSNPQGLAVDSSGDLWVAENGITDTSGDAVHEYNPAGTQVLSLGRSASSAYAGMSNPSDVALDGQGNVYVTEPDYDLVQEFNVDSLYEGEFGTPAKGAPTGTLYLPSAVAAGPDGQVYIADTGNHRVAEFVPQVPAKVTVQPVPAKVYAGFPAIFHAEAAGTPKPTVQWESQAPGATSFTPIAGATSDTLIIRGTTIAQSGTRYQAVFTNATGTATTSQVALTVTRLSAPGTAPNKPGGPGAPSWSHWPTSPSWSDILSWPGIPSWPAAASGRPSVPAPANS